MTPTQADREIWFQTLTAGCKVPELIEHCRRSCIERGEADDLPVMEAIIRSRLAAEAAAFEKAAGVFRECVVQQARDVAIRPVSPQSPGEWRDAVRQAAIRKLAGEKHD